MKSNNTTYLKKEVEVDRGGISAFALTVVDEAVLVNLWIKKTEFF